ncbi:MAG TPA: GAF domain-containing protein, partial [Terriglobales bacterium]|nr:GAF domain-containing protein [Terriglobales bacterium]
MQSGNNSAFSNVRSLVPEAAPDRRRRAELLLACASTLHAHLELRGVFAALTQHVRDLLDCASTELLVRRGHQFQRVARAAAEGAGEGRIPERTIHDFAQTVVASSGAVMVPLRTEGALLGVGMRTSETQAVLVAASGATAAFTSEDSSLLSAVAGIGNLAISNAELYDTAQSRARELQQLLDISAELGTAGELDTFLERFVVRAAEFLGFSRALIGVCEDGACVVRWIADAGVSRPLRVPLPEVLAQRVISGLESFTCEDSSQLGSMDFSAFGFEPRQILAVPLLGADRQALGMLAVMERRDGAGLICGEDIRRARALAAEAAIALEATRNAHLSRQYRRRSDSLMSAALELNSSLHLTQFVEGFTRRAADMLDAPCAALAISQGPRLEVAVLQQDGTPT